MEVQQDILTVVAPLRPGALDWLPEDLKIIGKDALNASLHPSTPRELMDFRALKTVHFARWVVLPKTKDARGRDLQACLLFSTCYDKPLKDHLHELISKSRPALDRTFGHCERYPGKRASEQEVAAYLRKHRVANAALFNGAPGRSVSQIEQEAELRNSIEQFLDGLDSKGMSPSAVRRAIQKYVMETPELRWALSRPQATPRQRLQTKWSYSRRLSPLLLVPIVIVGGITKLFRKLGLGWCIAPLATLVTLGAPFIFWLRHLEKTEEVAVDTAPDPTRVTQQEATEDLWGQNHFTRVNNIKRSPLRHMLLRSAIWLEDFFRRCVETKGTLQHIETIHSASWSFLNDHQRLIFMSNYDGGWEDYIGDFIRFARPHLNFGYSNTEKFPRTKLLVMGGVRDEQRYKAYLRNSQLPPAAWYSAYPHLSLKNINNNSFIRRDLWRPMKEKEVESWLQRF